MTVTVNKIVIKDSGTRTAFNTGAVRDAQIGKGRFDLLPYDALERVARIFEAGAQKYSARNWENGIPTHRFMDSGLRHALKYLGGRRDEDHLAMACWNLLCLLQTEEWIQRGDLPAELQTLPQPQSSCSKHSTNKSCRKKRQCNPPRE